MLLSIAIILICGLFSGWLCQRLRLPALVGMILTGILLGPYGFGLLHADLLQISGDIRNIALIIILTRAGLGLDLESFLKVSRPALLMSFVPASFELLGVLILAPILFGFTLMESALLGSVLAAVSPAVVVPRMVRLIDQGYGVNEGVPQLVLAGASVDDVYVIVLFSTFVSMMQGQGVSWIDFVNIPFSIILGILIGMLVGKFLARFFTSTNIRDTVIVLITLCLSFILMSAEATIQLPLTFSALIAIMFLGIGLKRDQAELAANLSHKYNQLWQGAEIFLFVLVGATVDVSYLTNVGPLAILLIAGGLVFRMIGVLISLFKSTLTRDERLFTMLAYTPKATVQAAIGGVPLALGFAVGETILSVAVLAIILTAPLGALSIDLTYQKLLNKS